MVHKFFGGPNSFVRLGWSINGGLRFSRRTSTEFSPQSGSEGFRMCLVFTHSEAGGHPTNEDAFEVRRHPDMSSCWVGSLADGQGGRSGGGEAAQLACRIVLEAVLSRPIASLSRAGTWVEALRQADARVLADAEAGFTTLIGFAVVGGQVIGASSGDSALWVAGADGRVVDLTERQSKNPPIGSGGAEPTPFIAKLSGSWVVLAMSDGVWKYVGREGVRAALQGRRGQELLDALLARARLPRSGGLQDDFTAVVLQSVV
jgi:serine/threonine protein phosphatase PrpC